MLNQKIMHENCSVIFSQHLAMHACYGYAPTFPLINEAVFGTYFDLNCLNITKCDV